MKLWTKNGKIITNSNGQPILCDTCPCGGEWYAIIGFRYRSTAGDNTGKLYDKCIYRYKVEAKKVINGKIMVEWASLFPSYGHPGYNIKYIDITKDLGQCASGLIWDGYDHQYTYEAYNISDKIYTDIDEFTQYFWSGCGVTPTEGVYPDIWYEVIYGDNDCWRMNNDVYTCINNHWKQVFTDRYIPAYNITYTQLCQDWKIYLQQYRWSQTQICDCYDDNGQWCGIPDPWPAGNCLQAGCTNKVCYTIRDQFPGAYIQACGQKMYKEPYNMDNQIWFDLVPGGPEYDYPGMIPCWDINSIGTTTNINNVLYNKIRDKDEYVWWQSYSYAWPGYDSYSSIQRTQSCNLGSEYCETLCISNHYWSGLVRSHQDVGNYWEYLFRWGILDLTRNQYTPSSAIGVKFDAVITNRVILYPNNNINNPNLSSVILSGQIDLYFGQTYKDLPLITDIPLTNIVQRPTCTDANCQNCSGYLNISPFAIEVDTQKHVTHPSAWIKQQGIYFDLVGKDYIFNNN